MPEEGRHCQPVTQTSKPYSTPLNTPSSPSHLHTVYKPIQVSCCLRLAVARTLTDSIHMFTSITIVIAIAYLYSWSMVICITFELYYFQQLERWGGCTCDNLLCAEYIYIYLSPIAIQLPTYNTGRITLPYCWSTNLSYSLTLPS